MPSSRRSFVRNIGAAGFTLGLSSRLAAQNDGLFRHGVASGDPLTDRVILWTRVTPSSAVPLVQVEWIVAEDPNFSKVLQRGVTSTNASFDYTVKIDVARLQPGTTYYYRFSSEGSQSPIGRTKTLPTGTLNRLRFAVASCSNFPFGYFNAYRLIAQRSDLDCVLHLGDYIYEYAPGEYGDGRALGRDPVPSKEIISLSDYRLRYSQYRLDRDLQEVHRQHPFIVVWDDHETTNDAWSGGAENHTPSTEGDWVVRRAAAAQAWFEWLPVRENVFQGSQIYRTFRFGDLADMIMLDTRLAGREQQVASNSPALVDPNRTLLGAEQEEWFLRQLSGSKARNAQWRIVGQQVMMGQLLGANGAPSNTDQWDGYPAARSRFLGYLGTNSINNVAVLTGDIHTSWGNEIAANPFAPAQSTRQAVEFVGPSITSPGITDAAQATRLEGQIGATHPHVKYVELNRRGYLLIDVDRDRIQGEWYHLRTILERSTDQTFARALAASSGTSSLTAVSEPSQPVGGSAPLAP